jgi:hypothetical protein
VNVAQDEDLLALLRGAGFNWMFLGIESPNATNLAETKKFQNMRLDLLTAVRRIYAAGIEVFGGFIVGFDNDTADTFEEQYRFITESGIQGAMVGLLTALPRTPLYDRLEKAGRLLPDANQSDNTKQGTNVIPLRMTYEEMMEGYRRLYKRLMAYRNIADRIKNKVRFLGTPSATRGDSWMERLGLLRRLLVRGVIPRGVSPLWHFVRSLPFGNPRCLPIVVQDWIVGLSMRDYVERNLSGLTDGLPTAARRRMGRLERSFRRYVQRGSLEVSVRMAKDAVMNLSFSVRGRVDRRFFRRAARHCERMLAQTTALVTLRIDALHDAPRRHWQRMLKRLARYGDRVYISMSDELKETIEVDSCVFHVVLDQVPTRT